MLEWLRVALVAAVVVFGGIWVISWLLGRSFTDTSLAIFVILFFVQGLRGRLFD